MVIDLAGNSGFIDAICSSDAFLPPQSSIYDQLTAKGRELWDQSKQTFADVWGGMQNFVRYQQYYKSQGHLRNDTAVYYLNNFESVLDAGLQMQHYVMAHPSMVKAYYQGIDLYPGYELPSTHQVQYARAMDNVVQFTSTGEEFQISTIDHQYDDLHQPTLDDRVIINQTYRYLKRNVFKQLKNLVLNSQEEVA